MKQYLMAAMVLAGLMTVLVMPMAVSGPAFSAENRMTLHAPVAAKPAQGRGAFRVVNACAAKCRAQHNQCRIRTKGSPSCDAQLSSCLQSCRRR